MNNQTCLILIALIILALVLLKGSISRKRRKNGEFDYSYMPYKQRNLLTKTEYAFFTVLKEECDKRDILLNPKVRLEDLVYVTDRENQSKYRGYVKSRHVDFVLTDSSLNVIAGIELDDPSHDTIEAARIDEFKNQLFQTIEVPLIRIKTGTDFEEEIEAMFQELG